MTVDSHIDRFITTPDDIHRGNRVDLSPSTVTELFALLGVTAAPWPKQKAAADRWFATSRGNDQLRAAWERFQTLVSDQSSVESLSRRHETVTGR